MNNEKKIAELYNDRAKELCYNGCLTKDKNTVESKVLVKKQDV